MFYNKKKNFPNSYVQKNLFTNLLKLTCIKTTLSISLQCMIHTDELNLHKLMRLIGETSINLTFYIGKPEAQRNSCLKTPRTQRSELSDSTHQALVPPGSSFCFFCFVKTRSLGVDLMVPVLHRHQAGLELRRPPASAGLGLGLKVYTTPHTSNLSTTFQRLLSVYRE